MIYKHSVRRRIMGREIKLKWETISEGEEDEVRGREINWGAEWGKNMKLVGETWEVKVVWGTARWRKGKRGEVRGKRWGERGKKWVEGERDMD